MRVFIDTSAFLAVLDADDRIHSKAKKKWEELVSSKNILISHNYILVETFALVQHRLGTAAVKVFNDDVLPVISVKWVDEATHKTAVSALITASRRRLSLVDCVSFEIMRQLGVEAAFTFDPHFAEQGFRCIP